MKILHTVESYYPDTNGMSEVVRQISTRLAKHGHSVTVATNYRNRDRLLIDGVRIKEFEISGNEVRGYKGNYKEYTDYILKTEFDIVTNFAAQQWASDLIFPLLSRLRAKKVFVPTGFSALYNPSYSTYFEKMKKWMNSYDMNIFLSNRYRDICFARENHITNLQIITNGASSEEFEAKSNIDIKKLLKIPIKHKLIILIGSHTGLKGHKEAIEIFNKANLNNASLVIIGDTNTLCYYKCLAKSIVYNLGRSKQKVHVVSLDRKSTVATMQQADLFLFPSNIECSPIVLFEAAAAKTPFLVTDVGNSKEIIEWLGNGLLLPTRVSSDGFSYAEIDKGAQLLTSLLQNEELLKKMSENGYKIWKEKYSWEKIAKQYEQLYLKLLKN